MQVKAEIESLVSPTPNIVVDGISRAPISAQYGAAPPQPASSPPPPSPGLGASGGWNDYPSYRPADVSYGGGYNHQGGRGYGRDSRPARGLDAVKPAWMTQGVGGGDPAVNPSGGVPRDDPARFHDFWQYASYYGESAARSYYQQWSPPVGMRPPPGMVIPSDDKRNGKNRVDSEYLATREAWQKYERDMEEWNRLYGGGASNGHRSSSDDQHASKRGRY